MKRFIPLFILLSFYACSPKQENSDQQTVEKPNIIFILADDLGYGDVGCYGQQKIKTPNIDRLADEGMKFTQHYSGSTVCAPARSTLMTGQHTGHTFIRGNKSYRDANGDRIEGQHPISAETVTVAERLQDAGYVTGIFGKWGLGAADSEGGPAQQGFNEFYGYACQGLAHRYYPTHLWHNNDKVILEGNDGQHTVQYANDSIQAHALKFIRDNKENTFFMYLPSIIPHAELIAPDDELLEQYRGKFPETPYKGRDYGVDYNPWGYCSQEIPHATFAAMVARLDKNVGEVIDLLKELGIDENTMVLFSSDNGPHLEGGADPDFFDSNGPLTGYKRDLYEGGIRVPMLVRWPKKVEAGSVTDHISAFWDFMPTALEAAEADKAEQIDGISFLPTLYGQSGNQQQHEYLYWEFHERGKRQAIRMGDWKGVKYDVAEDPSVKLKLFDLSKDVGEQNDVASKHPEIVTKLEGLLQEARTTDPLWPFFEGE